MGKLVNASPTVATETLRHLVMVLLDGDKNLRKKLVEAIGKLVNASSTMLAEALPHLVQ